MQPTALKQGVAYTVTFDAGDGWFGDDLSDTERTVTAAGGTLIDKSENPTPPEGKIFDGWVKQNGDTWNFDTDMVGANTVLTAKYAEGVKIDPIYTEDEKVTGTGEPGSEITVLFPDGTEETTTVNPDGTWEVEIPSGVELEKGDEITVTQETPDGVVDEKTTIVKGEAESTDPANPTDPTDPANPTDPSDTTKPAESTNSTQKPGTAKLSGGNTPKTGDAANILSYIGILIASFITIFWFIQKRRKTNN